jgi:hypothetical protein
MGPYCSTPCRRPASTERPLPLPALVGNSSTASTRPSGRIPWRQRSNRAARAAAGKVCRRLLRFKVRHISPDESLYVPRKCEPMLRRALIEPGQLCVVELYNHTLPDRY